jgi:hypothetical protein
MHGLRGFFGSASCDDAQSAVQRQDSLTPRFGNGADVARDAGKSSEFRETAHLAPFLRSCLSVSLLQLSKWREDVTDRVVAHKH